MKKVSFTEMKNGTKEDYIFLDKHEKNFADKTAERILEFMSNLTETLAGYQVSRLEHSLQCATRAYKNNESEEIVVAALLHDIGDELAPLNHAEYAAAILTCTSFAPASYSILTILYEVVPLTSESSIKIIFLSLIVV